MIKVITVLISGVPNLETMHLVKMETLQKKSWPNASPQVVKNEAVTRLQREGWNAAVLSKTQRGTTFEHSFCVGIQSLYVRFLQEAYGSGSEADPVDSLEQLRREANDLLLQVEELNKAPKTQEPVDPRFISSFFVYPKANALAAQGFYHGQMMGKSSEAESVDHKRQAAELYTKAARILPDDEEERISYLNCALLYIPNGETPVGQQLMITEQIRNSMSKVHAIWANSDMALRGRDAIVFDVMRKELEILNKIKAGRLSLDYTGPIYSATLADWLVQ
ncbi:hypothetical protein AX17_007374 [Amanita inopinata Kibby_2008]|nr:hypothetical protein AX17_007374 [Amanita inopinata Kibby_2008]